MIEEFKYKDDEILVKLSSVSSITRMFLLSGENRIPEAGLDLMEKIADGDTDFAITRTDLNIGVFSGVYALEIHTNIGKKYIDFFIEETEFKKCILSNLLSSNSCKDCLNFDNVSLINAFNILESLKFVKELGSVEQAFKLSDALDRYCNVDCRECGK